MAPDALQWMRSPVSRWRWLLPLCALLLLSACQKPVPPYTGGDVGKLTVVDQKVGTGVEARPGMQVLVHYTGWLYEQKASNKHGLKFDSTDDHGGTPFSFVLSQGKVIDGWDKGIVGMRVGGRRELLIPASLGYGARGAGGVIPAGASLVFQIELVDAEAP